MSENEQNNLEKQDTIIEDNNAEIIEEVVTQEDSQIESLQQEINELEDRVLRLQAEIANMQRRNTKERQNASKYRSQSLATSLLDPLDNLQRALDSEVTSEDAINLHKGVEMVLNQINRAFEEEKITEIDPINEPFDPEFHQAVSMIPGQEGQESQSVVQVLQKGYLLNDRIIRPAMVIVAE